MATAAPPDLMLLAINLTRRCNLRCAHCYLDAGSRASAGSDELDTGEVCAVLDDVAALGWGTMVVLTGGEPLLRDDLERIAAHGSGLGLAMVVGTNAMLLTESRVAALKQAGIIGAGISVDSLDPDTHDRFRGCPGAWRKTMAGIEACRRHHLSFQIHFSITDNNADELAAMIDFSRAAGARVLNIFFIVCVGRGHIFGDISRARYEQALVEIVEAQQHFPDLIIRPRCAPHFKRVAIQRHGPGALNRLGGGLGDGCIAGTRYCRVKPQGGVTACPYIEQEVGNVRTRPFGEIWARAPTFARLRAPTLKGVCGSCEFRRLCGGCRARPVAAGGDLMDSDSICGHRPDGSPVIEPLDAVRTGVTEWTDEARVRLGGVPEFLRGMVRKRAEAYAGEQGAKMVTVGHLETLSARRFGTGNTNERGS